MPATTADDLRSFDDLLQLDDRLITRGLDGVNWNDLVYAYIGANEEMRRKLRRGMSSTGARYLGNIAANWGAVDPTAVKATQARILEQYRALLRRLQSRRPGTAG